MSIFQILNTRDFLSESEKLDTLLIYIYIVYCNMLKAFVKNNIDYIMSLSRKIKLKTIIDYKIMRCYIIMIFIYNSITKILKRLFN